jgi:meso-butanediol dehydrogenase/(S,S)-butanediol dehydrogenase/diacetyl reductase
MEEFSSEILKGRVASLRGHHRDNDVPRLTASDYMTGQIVMIDGGMTLV